MGIFGLMTMAEHNRLSDERVDLLEASLASKDATIDRVVDERDRLLRKLADAFGTIDELSPDAEAMRAKRQRDRDLKAGRAKAAPTVNAVTSKGKAVAVAKKAAK